MNLKNKKLIIFFAMNMCMMQSLQAMEWFALKAGSIALLSVGLAAYKLKDHFGNIKKVEEKVDAVNKKVDHVQGSINSLTDKMASDFGTTLADLQALRVKFDTMQSGMSQGFADAKQEYEAFKSNLMSRLQQTEDKLITEFGETSEALKNQVTSMMSVLKQELFHKMSALEAKIEQLATKEDMQDTISQALDPIHAQLNQIAENQNRQAQLFEQAIQTLSGQINNGNNQIVHTILDLPGRFTLADYIAQQQNGAMRAVESRQRLLGGKL